MEPHGVSCATVSDVSGLPVSSAALDANLGIPTSDAEMDRAAVMVGRAQVFEIQDRQFAARNGNVFVCCIGGKAADAVMNRRRQSRVINIDEAVRSVIRIESNA